MRQKKSVSYITVKPAPTLQLNYLIAFPAQSSDCPIIGHPHEVLPCLTAGDLVSTLDGVTERGLRRTVGLLAMKEERACHSTTRSYQVSEVPLADERVIHETAARRCTTCPADGAISEGDLLPYAWICTGESA